jgi:hypothetical protein
VSYSCQKVKNNLQIWWNYLKKSRFNRFKDVSLRTHDTVVVSYNSLTVINGQTKDELLEYLTEDKCETLGVRFGII